MARPVGHRTAAHGGGNFTRGAHRRGNKNGRKPLHPPGTPLSAANIKLTDSQRALCLMLGAGQITRGLRVALDMAARVMPLWAQDLIEVSRIGPETVHGKGISRAVLKEARTHLEAGLRATWDTAIVPPDPEDEELSEPLPPIDPAYADDEE